ncbi:MAG: dnaN, partial [Acidobacteria bacterium]|nr:dnaN [Acidobacteriota bacterium]
VGRQELSASLRRVALLTSERTHGVQMTVDREGLTLTSVGFDVGQAEEQVSCTYTGEPVKVFVNAQYLLDFLGAVETGEIEIQIRDGDGPVVMLPVGDDERIQEALYVIMPIRL